MKEKADTKETAICQRGEPAMKAKRVLAWLLLLTGTGILGTLHKKGGLHKKWISCTKSLTTGETKKPSQLTEERVREIAREEIIKYMGEEAVIGLRLSALDNDLLSDDNPSL